MEHGKHLKLVNIQMFSINIWVFDMIRDDKNETNGHKLYFESNLKNATLTTVILETSNANNNTTKNLVSFFFAYHRKDYKNNLVIVFGCQWKIK